MGFWAEIFRHKLTFTILKRMVPAKRLRASMDSDNNIILDFGQNCAGSVGCRHAGLYNKIFKINTTNI